MGNLTNIMDNKHLNKNNSYNIERNVFLVIAIILIIYSILEFIYILCIKVNERKNNVMIIRY